MKIKNLMQTFFCHQRNIHQRNLHQTNISEKFRCVCNEYPIIR